MAQRYHDDMSHWRMDNGNCPECGEKPAQHLSDSRFWIPRNCSLLPQGVTERIEQYKADRAVRGGNRTGEEG